MQLFSQHGHWLIRNRHLTRSTQFNQDNQLDPHLFKSMYKIGFKSIHAQAPAYLSTLIHIYKPTRALRSTNHTKIVPPGYKYERIGAHAFAISASSLFNALPENLRDEEDIGTLKSLLKTHLFRRAYKLRI